MQLPLGLGFPGMRVIVLGSGSSGNSVVLESGSKRLMIDAGFSCRELEKRLELAGIAPRGFQGLLLTHEHGDHVRGAGRFSRRHRVPIHATGGTFAKVDLGRGQHEKRVVQSGRPFRAGCFEVEPFRVPHDAAEPIGFVIQDPYGRRVGIAADLGTRSKLAWARLRDLDVLILETNHDLQMLRDGPYPWHLKQRIAGRFGHLSNADAAQGARELVGDRLQWVVLYHLSTTNNSPALALEAVREELSREGCSAELCVSQQAEPTPWLELA